MINTEIKKDVTTRLRRIEGQVKGLIKMVHEEKYCIDLIDQSNAIRRALEQVALIIMKRHMESCVAESIRSKGGKDKTDELMLTIERFVR